MKFLIGPIIMVGLFFLTFGVGNLFSKRNVLVAKDFMNIPKRFINGYVMEDEEIVIGEFRELKKLREFIKNLDIPLKSREVFMWSIDSEERKLASKLSSTLEEKTLKKLREE